MTAENRGRICRTLFALSKNIFLFNQKKFFCYNLITSGNSLVIDDRNMYSAVEIVTVKPLYNEFLDEKFIETHSWTTSLQRSLRFSIIQLVVFRPE